MRVVKNNLKSLLIHVIISILSIIIFIVFGSSQAKWVSEEAARRHHNYMMIFALTLIAVALILYYLLGRKLLIKQGSIYKNLISTILTGIIGILIWVIAFSLDFTANGGYLLNSDVWQLYSSYNGYSSFFLYESSNNNHYVFLLFSFLPTITMSLGMLKKEVI